MALLALHVPYNVTTTFSCKVVTMDMLTQICQDSNAVPVIAHQACAETFMEEVDLPLK